MDLEGRHGMQEEDNTLCVVLKCNENSDCKYSKGLRLGSFGREVKAKLRFVRWDTDNQISQLFSLGKYVVKYAF